MATRDSPRWCDICRTYGDHHTDRHPTCPICDDDGWYEVWDDDGDNIIANVECPKLNDPDHAPWNATGVLS